MLRPRLLISSTALLVTTLVPVLAVAQVERQPGQAPAPATAQAQPNQPPPASTYGAPPWMPLAPDHAAHLKQILDYWEFTTGETKRYRCVFKRWEYEPKLSTYSEGVIKYAAPDKGLFEVSLIKQVVGPPAPDGTLKWKEEPADGFRQHWVCDGKSIFEFDHPNKQLKQRPLPPDMQGKRITDGPLPFMFGAKAAEIQRRFWIRVITPPNRTGQFWLEALPKTQADAANFTKIHVILAEKDFLPEGMVLFHRNRFQTTFQFDQRETNWSILQAQLNPFMRQFFQPKIPKDWELVVEPFGGQPPLTQAQSGQPIRPLQLRR